LNDQDRKLIGDIKRSVIMQAALQEFAQQGYEKASTNQITQKAGVSKGLLFHYFGSKKQLYLDTLDMCIDHFLICMDEKLDSISKDIFQRIIDVNLIKLEMLTSEPVMQQIVTQAFLDPPEEVKSEIQTRQERIEKQYLPYLTNEIDTRSFRKDIESYRLVNYIVMVVNSLGDKYIQAYKAANCQYPEVLQDFIVELEEYLDLIKYGVCEQ